VKVGNKVQYLFCHFSKRKSKQNIVAGSGGLSCMDRQVILETHNKARQNVALGRVPGQPGASNMLEMVSETQRGQGNERFKTNELSSVRECRSQWPRGLRY
jgi:hypothetical protein